MSMPMSMPMSERMVLIEPGLGENLLIQAQEESHLDGVRPLGGQIELCAPMSGHLVRHGFGKNIRERAARRPQDGFGLLAEWNIDERSSQKFHHEFAHAVR